MQIIFLSVSLDTKCATRLRCNLKLYTLGPRKVNIIANKAKNVAKGFFETHFYTQLDSII